MQSNEPACSRRQWLAGAADAFAGVALGESNREERAGPFGYCLNTSTIQGQKARSCGNRRRAATAGYQAIEPWLAELQRYASSGRIVHDLGRRIRDRGLTVAGVIASFEWAVNDPEQHRPDLEAARRASGSRAGLRRNRI